MSDGEPAGGPLPPGGRDPSVQPERTRLSWRRTTLAAAVVMALAWRHALFVPNGTLSYLVAGGGTSLWLALVTVAQRRIRRLALSPTPALGVPTVWAVCACTLALTLCGALLVR